MAKEDSMTALMEATIRLLAERGQAAITVRDIAAEAGVNHGLVHHYFGSKAELVRRAVVRASEALYQGQPPELSVGWTFRFFRDHPELVPILARVALDGSSELFSLVGPPPDRLAGWLAELEGLAGGLGWEVNPRILNAFGVAAIVGWFLFKPLFERALDLPDRADDELAAWLEVIDEWIHPGQGCR